MATLAYEVCQLHPRLNSDLLLTAAITHDLGRTREFTYGAEIGLTDEGRLLGHLVIGERMLSERMGALDEERRLALLHCVLSHHGPPTAPGGRFASAEAMALYRCNALDASVKGAFEQGLLGQRDPGRAARALGPTITGGAARAWWPIQSSKLAGPGSPRLGRFDSFAASCVVGAHSRRSEAP